MAGLQQDDLVVFVGPVGNALQWPVPGERGVIQRIVKGGVHVMWERSPLLVAWPVEWLEPAESASPGAAEA